MERRVSATQAHIRFGEVMRAARQGPVIVERDGKPEVVVLSKAAYDNLVSGSISASELLQIVHENVRRDLELHLQALDMSAWYHLPAAYGAHYLALAERTGAELYATDQKLVNTVGDRTPVLIRCII